MKILFLGHLGGNSKYHYINLKKKFKNISAIDLDTYFRKFKIIGYIFNNVSPLIFEQIIYLYIVLKNLKEFDLIYVTSGEYFGGNTIKLLKKKCKKIILYCPDNPFVKRDNKRWKLLLKSINIYDHVVFIQPSREKYTKKNKIKNYSIFYPHYEDKVHKKISNKKKYDVVFIGTWFPERGKFIKELIKKGLNIKVFGSRWNKDPEYEKYSEFFVVKNFSSKEYSLIINFSKIALCFYSSQNQDTITTRSIEIPAIGTFMLSQDSYYQRKLLKNKIDTHYFKTINECFNLCNYYIKKKIKRELIAKNANYKITKKMNLTYKDFINKILKIYEN